MLRVAQTVRRKSIQAIESIRQLSLDSTISNNSSEVADSEQEERSSRTPPRTPPRTSSMAFPGDANYSNSANVYGTYPRKPWLTNGGGQTQTSEASNPPNGMSESNSLRGILRNKYQSAIRRDDTFDSAADGAQEEVSLRTDAPPRKVADSRMGRALEFYIRPAVAEFVSVMFAVFTVALVEASLENQGLSDISRNTYIAATEAVVFLVFLLAFQRIHLNPAVTLASLFGASTPWALCLLFWLIQILAATIGAMLLQLVMEGHSLVVPVISAKVSEEWLKDAYKLVLCQATTTFMLVLSYLQSYQPTACTKCDSQIFRNPTAIISAVALCAFVSGLTSTASWNPAKNLAVSLAVTIKGGTVHSWHYHFIFWLGPLIGSLFASFLYRLIFADNERRLSACGAVRQEEIV